MSRTNHPSIKLHGKSRANRIAVDSVGYVYRLYRTVKDISLCLSFHDGTEVKGKGKGQVLDIALLHDEHMPRSALKSR